MIICTLGSLMKNNDVNQSRIVEETGITRPTLLTLIRNTNKSIRYETVNQLCKFFNIDMSELLVYSPVEVELKKVITEKIPISMDEKFEKNNSSVIISLLYNIDGYELEFDTNLVADRKKNSLTHSKKMLFNCLIYEDELSQLEAKGFDKNFLKTYNDHIDIEKIIKDKMKVLNLNTEFQINNCNIEINPIKRDEKYFSLKDIEELIEKTSFSKDEKERALSIIEELENDLKQGD